MAGGVKIVKDGGGREGRGERVEVAMVDKACGTFAWDAGPTFGA